LPTALNVDSSGLDYVDNVVALSSYSSLGLDSRGLNYIDSSVTLLSYLTWGLDSKGLGYVDKTIGLKTIAVAGFDLSWLILLLIFTALVSVTLTVAKKYRWLGNPYVRD
jgi:hypothetical protein